jgi:glycosyltransferase involved in cell wall biosynthesis
MKADLLISAVSVIHNDAAVLPAFLEEVSAALAQHYANYEVLLVDNGSTDETDQVVQQLLERHKCIRCLRLTRLREDEIALMAGLDAAIGDYVVTLHPDFDPPAEIARLVERCRDGADLVLGVDRHPPASHPLYRLLRGSYLALSRRMLRFQIVVGTTGLRAMSRQAVNALVKVRLRRRYFAIIAADVGLITEVHPYERISRSGRRPLRRLLMAIRIGLSVIVHNSIAPLRMASVIGLLGSFLSLLYSLYVVAIYLFKPDVMPGWTTLSLVMSGLFGAMFVMLALMGEYLGRLLEESAERPLYHVRDEQSSAVMLADLSRRNVLDRSEVPSESQPP